MTDTLGRIEAALLGAQEIADRLVKDSQLTSLEGDEVSLVKRSANRRRFLVTKDDDPAPAARLYTRNESGQLCMDEIVGLEMLAKIDAQGEPALNALAALAAPDEDFVKDAWNPAPDLDLDHLARYKMGLKVMGPRLARILKTGDAYQAALAALGEWGTFTRAQRTAFLTALQEAQRKAGDPPLETPDNDAQGTDLGDAAEMGERMRATKSASLADTVLSTLTRKAM